MHLVSNVAKASFCISLHQAPQIIGHCSAFRDFFSGSNITFFLKDSCVDTLIYLLTQCNYFTGADIRTFKLPTMIEGIDIYKNYGDLAVLKGVKIQIGPSEIVSIMGKSGAGKSTLLHILGTLDNPDRGQVVIDGQNVSQLKNRALAEFRNRTIGFVFQFHHLLPEFSARENIMIPGLIMKLSKKEAGQRADELLEYLGLSPRAAHKPGELSGGEQQRVAVGRALINNPKVIFADEPTGNLDSQTSDDLHRLILKLREDLKHTFVIVTHNSELAKLSDRTLVMEDGKFIDQL